MTKILVPFSNKLQICHFLVELRCIHRLERVLIARRLQFKKVTIMLKGESPKFKGTICNVPKYVVFTCNTLSYAANINDLVTVKLKKNWNTGVIFVKVPHQYLLVMFCEELRHSHLFPFEKFGFQIKRQIALSPTKYFHQRLLSLISPAMFLNFSKLYFWGVLGGKRAKNDLKLSILVFHALYLRNFRSCMEIFGTQV